MMDICIKMLTLILIRTVLLALMFLYVVTVWRLCCDYLTTYITVILVRIFWMFHLHMTQHVSFPYKMFLTTITLVFLYPTFLTLCNIIIIIIFWIRCIGIWACTKYMFLSCVFHHLHICREDMCSYVKLL